MTSSSTSSIQKPLKYHVFLSFRGEDVRTTFVGHLYDALKRGGIYTYKDDENMEKGERIADDLSKAIKESNIFIIVFSENYASSSWCLNELVKIMECRNTSHHRIVYPIFYHVDPSNVRKQSGPFGEVFARHDTEEVGKWREALKGAGNLAGHVLNKTDPEAEFIKKVVRNISRKLQSVHVYIDKRTVGMEARVKKVLSLLETSIDDVHMIGIWGIGGGGKTTLARNVFNQISTRFDGKSFVENIKASPKERYHSLQEQVLLDVLNDPYIRITNVDNGKSMLKNRLQSIKVLIVLDGVDEIDQLEALAGERDWFKPGSLIIITTSDKKMLDFQNVNSKQIQKVDLLSYEEAICLFSRYAFGTDIPTQGYEMLSREVVDYAAGLPLMIKALGVALRGKDEDICRDRLGSLKKEPLEKPMVTLKMSYISLGKSHKQIFLDVACFLKSRHKDYVVRILKSCGFDHVISGLDALEDKSLITISDDQYVDMHDLIQDMGRYVVRHPHHDDPERHSRLWILDEIEDILAKDLGTNNEIRAIAVDDKHVKPISKIVTKGFGDMKKLRFLRLVSETDDDDGDDDDDDGDGDGRCDEKNDHVVSQTLPDALQYLSWRSYPHWSLPIKFGAENLVSLEMSNCRILQLWQQGKKRKEALSKLKFLDLSSSKLRTLDLGLTPNLETLDLNGCRDLKELCMPDDDACLKSLVSLNLEGCKKIKSSLMFIKQLETLQDLSLTRLYLKEFPEIIPEHRNNRLRQLYFKYNDVKELPSTIDNLKELVHLDLYSCRNLRSLPGSICDLRQLRNLTLKNCILLKELPEGMGRLKCLENLFLSYTKIKQLPDSISKLKRLKTLKLSSCWKLVKLPEDIGRLKCLEKLILKKCTKVEDIPHSICKLKMLKYLNLLDCVELKTLPRELGDLVSLKVLNVKGTSIRHVPRSISLLEGLKIIQDSNSSYRSREYASGRSKYSQ